MNTLSGYSKSIDAIKVRRGLPQSLVPTRHLLGQGRNLPVHSKIEATCNKISL